MRSIWVYLTERPNIPVLIMLVLFMLGCFAYPVYIGVPVPEFIRTNAPVIFMGVVTLLIPLFIFATRATLLSDLVDQEMLPKWKDFLVNIDNFDHSPLKMAVVRLYLSKADSRSSSMKNLALGVGFTVISVTLVIQLTVSANAPIVMALPVEDFLIKHIGPKVGAVFFIQAIGIFFFRHYSKNLKEISAISDRILFFETKLAALSVSDMHREKLQNFLVDFDLDSALALHVKRKSTVRWPRKAVETVNLTVGK